MEEMEQESIFVVNPFVKHAIEMMKATAAVRYIILLSTWYYWYMYFHSVRSIYTTGRSAYNYCNIYIM